MQREYESLSEALDMFIVLAGGGGGHVTALAPDGMYRTVVVDMLGGSYFEGQRPLLLVVLIFLFPFAVDVVLD